MVFEREVAAHHVVDVEAVLTHNVVRIHLPQHIERQPAWWAHRCSNAQSESRELSEHLPAKKVRGKA